MFEQSRPVFRVDLEHGERRTPMTISMQRNAQFVRLDNGTVDVRNTVAAPLVW